MNPRLQSIVHGLVLALIVGWLLYIGQGIFVPIIFSVLLIHHRHIPKRRGVT